MRFTALACAAVLMLGTGMAAAQTAYPDAPSPVAAPASPPPDTLSTTRKVQAVDAYGNRYEKTETTYRNSNGVAQDSTTTRTTVAPPPPPPPVTSSSTTTTTTTAPQ